MIQLSCNDIVKYYGAECILHGVSAEVNEEERVAIVGPNGCGKSTLLKILAKEEQCEAGNIALRKGLVVGYLDQMPKTKPNMSVEDVLMSGLSEVNECHKRMLELEKKLSEDTDQMEHLLKQYSEVSLQYEHLGGYQVEERLSRVYQGLQIESSMLIKEFDLLSGGEKTLILLARILLQNPDVLILDEPTNHLDLSMLGWLEDYLSSYKGSVLFVSHDRYFLSKVATKVIDLEGGKAKVYPYGYDKYVEEKEKATQLQEEQYKEQQKQIKRLEASIKRLRQWAKQADNKKMFRTAASMQKRLDRTERVERPKDQMLAADLSFDMLDRSGKDVLVIEDLCKAFGNKTLFDHAWMNLYYQEHVALVGKNGCGKSTLLKMIFGEEEPASGYIKLGASLKIAYLPQIVSFAHEDWTILDTFREGLNLSEGDTREILAKHLFKKETVFKTVGKLSGGERTRLKFAMLIQQDINFLVLDEPTNHLDIPARQRLEEALLQFKGTILMISHDRYFMNRLTTRMIELEDGCLTSYPGGYDDYLTEKAKKKSIEELDKNVKKDEKISTSVTKPRERETIEKKPSRYSCEIKLAQVEAEIEVLEQQKEELEQQIAQAVSDYVTLSKYQEDLAKVEKQLEACMEEWTNISSILEEMDSM